MPEYIINIEVLYMKIVLFRSEWVWERDRQELIICVKCLVTYNFRHNERENEPNVFEHCSSVHEFRTS